MAKKTAEKTVYLISNGDFRESACLAGWPKQDETLREVKKAFAQLGVKTEVLPKFDSKRGHGFVTRQCQGANIFSKIEPNAPVVVVLSIWAYAHHVCGPLATHKGPILLLANFDGTWPGLVSLLNHAGSLDRLDKKHSRLWSESFTRDDAFMKRLARWVKTGRIDYSQSHLSDAADLKLSTKAKRFGDELAAEIKRDKRIMGQLDPGCMGMLNAVISPAKLGAIGMPVEYLNQSDLVAEMGLVSDAEAQDSLNWLLKKGATFDWGTDQFAGLTHAQVLSQMKMYSAAGRYVERFGLSAIGIPYQLGLVRCVPASDLVEGMLNNGDRPPIVSPDSGKVIQKGKPIVHFNEGDIGAGVPQRLMFDIYERLGMPSETTLHDIRWGREYDGKFVWVFLISGAAPPAHFGGWKNTTVYRQSPVYFPLGGGTCSGVSKPGTITWARFYEAFGEIGMDCGTGEVVEMPDAEVKERLTATSEVWPIANTYIPGYGRDEMMSTHMSNHIVIGYGDILQELVATCLSLGIPTRVAGDARNSFNGK